MRQDPSSNNTFVGVDASASLAAAANRDSASVNLAEAGGGGVAFLLYVSSVGTGGILTAKQQHSPDDSAWTDEIETAGDDAGNDANIVISTIGLHQLNMPNPRDQFARVNGAATVDAVVYDVIAVTVA